MTTPGVTQDGVAEQQARQDRIQALLARPSSSGTMRFVASVALGVVVCVVLSLAMAPRYGAVTLSRLLATALP